MLIFFNDILYSFFKLKETGRRLSQTPWWVDFLVMFLLGGMFYYSLKFLMSISEGWKKVMQKRIDMQIAKRKAANDPFREQNGYSWDYIVVFKVIKADDKLTDMQENGKFSMRTIVSRLAEAGLQTKLFFSIQNDEVYCKIRCPLTRLLKEAHRIGHKLQLSPFAISNALSEGHLVGSEDHDWAPVNIPKDLNQSYLDPYDFIYASFVKEKIDLFQVQGNNTIFRGVDRLKLIQSIIKARMDVGGCHMDLYKMISKKAILAYFPLHDLVELRSLEGKWLRFLQPPWLQKVDDVRNYYGEKIALYFLWLGHYTTWLIGAAAAGLLVWMIVAGEDNNPDSPIMPYFAAFIAVWSSMFVETWYPKEKLYAMKWGTVGYEEIEQERTEFKGPEKPSPVTGVKRQHFSIVIFYQRVAFSSAIITLLICVVSAMLAAIFYFKIYYTVNSSDLIYNGTNYASTIAGLLNALQIQFMNYVYGLVSVALNDYENHRTDTQYEDALIIKTFAFQFVNSYATLFYVAFVKPYLTADPCYPSCMLELQASLGTIFLTRLATGNFLKLFLPWLDSKMRTNSETKGTSGRALSEVEKMFLQAPYYNLDTFNCYADMMIQFGYATLFVTGYPLSAVMALINNYISLRIEAWKLTQLCRRPEPLGAEDLGTWAGILELLMFAAVGTNCAMVIFTSASTINLTWSSRTWIFILMISIFYSFKLLIAFNTANVSDEVVIQLGRQDFIVGKLFENIADDDLNDAKLSLGALKVEYTIRINDDDPL